MRKRAFLYTHNDLLLFHPLRPYCTTDASIDMFAYDEQNDLSRDYHKRRTTAASPTVNPRSSKKLTYQNLVRLPMHS